MHPSAFNRLLQWSLLLVALCVLAPRAFAYGTVAQTNPTTTHTEYRFCHNFGASNQCAAWFTSQSAACDGMMGLTGNDGSGGVNVVDSIVAFTAPSTCQFTRARNGTHQTTVITAAPGMGTQNNVPDPAFCPSNSTGTTTCVCDAGFKPNAPTGATSCVAIGACETVAHALNLTQMPVTSTGGAGNLVACYGGCTVESDFGGTGSDGGWWLFGPFKASGTTCQGTSNSGTDTSAAPTPCAAGTCPGTVGGTSVCVACASTVEKQPETTTTTPAGAASAPTGTTAGSTSTKTTCADEQCSTVTTVKDAGGNTIAQTTKTDDKASFCKDNPNLATCKKDAEGSFGGSCSGAGGTFTCTGDAVQCAIAQEQHKRACEAAYVSSATQSVYDGLKGSGVAPSASDTSIDLSSATPAAPTGSCAVTDTTITFGSGVTAMSLSFPLGTLICPHLTAIRTVITAFGGLMFALIVSGHKGG